MVVADVVPSGEDEETLGLARIGDSGSVVSSTVVLALPGAAPVGACEAVVVPRLDDDDGLLVPARQDRGVDNAQGPEPGAKLPVLGSVAADHRTTVVHHHDAAPAGPGTGPTEPRRDRDAVRVDVHGRGVDHGPVGFNIGLPIGRVDIPPIREEELHASIGCTMDEDEVGAARGAVRILRRRGQLLPRHVAAARGRKRSSPELAEPARRVEPRKVDAQRVRRVEAETASRRPRSVRGRTDSQRRRIL